MLSQYHAFAGARPEKTTRCIIPWRCRFREGHLTASNESDQYMFITMINVLSKSKRPNPFNMKLKMS